MNAKVYSRLLGSISILLILVAFSASQSYAQGGTGRLTTNYSCNKFSFSDANGTQKRVFRPGETIYVTYADSTKPFSVEVFFADLSNSNPNWGAQYVMNWKKLGDLQPSSPTYAPGTWASYNSATGVFLGTINITAGLNIDKNTEILVVANVKSTSTSYTCSGNPIYPGAPNGVWIGGGSPATPSPCSGCQALVAIDLTSPTYTEDTTSYWKLDPGNNWTYQGFNTSYISNSAYLTFTSRIDVENSVKMCDRAATPIRFTKNNMYGYWGARYSWQDSGWPWTGDYSRRFFTTAFLSDNYWNGASYMGAIGAKSYTLPGGENNFKILGGLYANNQVYFSSPQQNFYFPSYFMSPRFLDPSASYLFERNDRLFYPYRLGITSDTYCSSIPDGWATKYLPPPDGIRYEKDHGWHLDIKATTLNIFGQNVSALRYRWIEFQYPMGSGYIQREDWYAAKGIGLARLDGKDVSHYRPRITWEQCLSEPMCLGKDFFDTPTKPSDNGGKVIPDATMSMTNKYLGGTLSAYNSLDQSNWGSTIVLQYGINQTWYLKLSENYTGWVDVYTSYNDGPTLTKKWDWANNGIIVRTKPASLARGIYKAMYRPHTIELADITPAPANETQLNVVYTPWTNQITNIVQ